MALSKQIARIILLSFVFVAIFLFINRACSKPQENVTNHLSKHKSEQRPQVAPHIQELYEHGIQDELGSLEASEVVELVTLSPPKTAQLTVTATTSAAAAITAAPTTESFNSLKDITSTTTEALEREVTLAERLKVLLKCNDIPLMLEKTQYSEYWLLRNYIRGSISKTVGCAETITYTTNGDYTFFDNLALVVTRWLAPISFAIYAPGYDFNSTMDAIQYVRQCLPESDLIRQYVTFHIYFPQKHMPSYVPLTEAEALSWPYNCNVSVAPYANVSRSVMYKTAKNLTYPINVGRNIARRAANTYFVFPCDIELVPSVNLVQKFLEILVRDPSVVLEGDSPRVFPLAVFEVEKTAHIPASKTALVAMLHNKTAIPFHSKICQNCHLVPMQKEWLELPETDELSVSAVSKREGKFRYWEPFYISDNKEPMFDERVTWEGQSNKRIQGHAMCLLGYDYKVLNSAFLVHRPGIKYLDRKSPRLKFVPPMNRLIKHVIEPEYRLLYGSSRRCST